MGLPKFMEDILKIKAHIKKDTSIKDGPALSKVVSAYLKLTGSVHKAIKLFDEEKKSGSFKRAYDEAKHQMDEKRYMAKMKRDAIENKTTQHIPSIIIILSDLAHDYPFKSVSIYPDLK